MAKATAAEDASADAFYTPTGDPDVVATTVHCTGPWNPAAQHGGPPSGLLVRALERIPSSIDGPATLARVTIDILGPVPMTDLRTAGRVSRPGRSVELLEAEMHAAGRVVLRARAWRIRTAPVDLPAGGEGVAPPPPVPLAAAGAGFSGELVRMGFAMAMEWRPVRGGFDTTGPALVWARQRVPLVAGEEPSGTQRLMLLADCGNGLSRVYGVDTHLFINTDLTVHLNRPPVGEWLCTEAVTTIDPSGIGLAESRLFDATGRVGRAAQSLLVAAR